jgi:hypothetical protein
MMVIIGDSNLIVDIAGVAGFADIGVVVRNLEVVGMVAVGAGRRVAGVADRWGPRVDRVGLKLEAVDSYKPAALPEARALAGNLVEGVPFLQTLRVRLRLLYFLFF